MSVSVRRYGGPIAVALAALGGGTAAAWAQAPAAREQTVTVSAVGRVAREPDRAVLLLAVESFATTAREAAAANARKMDALLAALRRLGLGEDDVRTVSYQLNPEYEFSPAEPRRQPEQRLVGYRAVNTVSVTIDEVDRVGAVIDAAVDAGADRVTGLSFQLRDPEAARREALREAVAKANAEAEALAAALGRRLGPALTVTTGGRFPPPIPVAYDMRVRAAEMAVPTPIEPGTLDVEAAVTVVYRLESRP